MHTVYCIKNKENGKVYIGMTSRAIEERWKAHISCSNNSSPFRFHSAIRKYGVDNFELHELAKFETKEESAEFEEFVIDIMNTVHRKIGYNAKPGGCGGFIVPEEKIESWKKKLKKTTHKENNGRWSDISDDFILEKCKEYSDETNNFSYGMLLKLYPDFPKSFSKNRFNGKPLRQAFFEKYNFYLPKYQNTKEHNQKVRKSLTGKFWYYNELTGVSIQTKENLQYPWIKNKRGSNGN
jgi:group I intron endonuclease